MMEIKNNKIDAKKINSLEQIYTIEVKENSILIVGKSYKNLKIESQSILIRPHAKGIHCTKEYIFNKDSRCTKESYIIPGEVDFKRTAIHLSSGLYLSIAKTQKNLKSPLFESEESYINNISRKLLFDVSSALKKSNIWKNRGKSDIKNESPKDFWKLLSVDNILKLDGHHGPKRIWQNMIYEKRVNEITSSKNIKIPINKAASTEIFKKAVELGLYPETPWSIRKWNKIGIQDLLEHTKSGTTASPHWGSYVSTCYMFDEMLKQHSVFNRKYDITNKEETRQNRHDKLLQFLVKWPKNSEGIEILNKAYNQGMITKNIIDSAPKSINHLNAIISIWKEIRSIDRDKKRLNENYRKLNIELPDGWRWVDETNAHLMSDKYGNCFSNSQEYINGMCDGVAHAAFREIITKDDTGAFCYFRLHNTYSKDINEKKWIVSQISAYRNGNVADIHRQKMEIIARTINATHPGQHPIVIQDFDKAEKARMLVDSDYARVKGIYLQYQENQKNIRNEFYFETDEVNIEKELENFGYTYNEEKYCLSYNEDYQEQKSNQQINYYKHNRIAYEILR